MALTERALRALMRSGVSDGQQKGDGAMTEWARKKLEFLDKLYGKQFQQWYNAGHSGDRWQYCHLFMALRHAIESIREVENNTVYVAMNRYIEEKAEEMDAIRERFNGGAA